jgi:simple sugar transport system ATP-binding protein
MTVELLKISKQFAGVPALREVSLTIRRGERLALIGENGAGKSSLMNVLYALYRPDSGEIRLDGTTVHWRTPADAIAHGIGMVHQHFTLVPALTVAENVVLGNEPRRGLRLDLAKAERDVERSCLQLGFSLDPNARVEQLSVGSQQKVEIVKALHRGATTLILDEPTAVLTPQESRELLRIVENLSESNHAVVLISHKLKEVLQFATRIAVMRRGEMVGEVFAKHATPTSLAAMMIEGGGGDARAPAAIASAGAEGSAADATDDRRAEPATTATTAQGKARLCLDRVCATGLSDISLELFAGEIVGIAGVDGNGQRELAHVVTGLLPLSSGSLVVDGVRTTALLPKEARALGIAHIPEDRLRFALVSEMTVEENAALGCHRAPPYARGVRIDFQQRAKHAEAIVDENDVRPRDLDVRAGILSGGNQQKFVVGRELSRHPTILVVVQPTRGLDITAIEAVRQALRAQRSAGAAILLISLDLDEVLALSDRVFVLHDGRLNGEFSPPNYDELAIGRRMLGVPDAA